MLILGVSGRKQSGKSTTGNFIFSLYMSNLGISEKIYINEFGQIMVSDLLGDTNYSGVFDPTKHDTRDYVINQVFNKISPIVKIYNFADTLKQDICISILGLTQEQCYGSDDDKNSLTEIKWENMPGYNASWMNNEDFHSSGFMTARQVMEFVGTNIFRQIKTDVWIESTIKKITKDKPSLAIITDCRFPNEADKIKTSGGKILRLTRDPFKSSAIAEVAMDRNNYNWDDFDFILNNHETPILDQLSNIKDILQEMI